MVLMVYSLALSPLNTKYYNRERWLELFFTDVNYLFEIPFIPQSLPQYFGEHFNLIVSSTPELPGDIDGASNADSHHCLGFYALGKLVIVGWYTAA